MKRIFVLGLCFNVCVGSINAQNKTTQKDQTLKPVSAAAVTQQSTVRSESGLTMMTMDRPLEVAPTVPANTSSQPAAQKIDQQEQARDKKSATKK